MPRPPTNHRRTAPRSAPSGSPAPRDNPPTSAFPRMKPPFDVAAMLVGLFKWLLYTVLIVLGAWLLWTHRYEVMAAFSSLGQWLADLWHNLFGGKAERTEKAAAEAGPKAPPAKRFADFTDPFAAGTAGSYPPEELVRYTFEALEAWARDQGYPRQPEQTPHEFTRGLASHVAALTDGVGRLAELYCQVAYAPGTLSLQSVARLSHLWATLRSETDAYAEIGR